MNLASGKDERKKEEILEAVSDSDVDRGFFLMQSIQEKTH